MNDRLSSRFGPSPDCVSFFGQLLAPPEGMVLRQAIGTTFTLDLETALIPPLMTLGLANEASDARGFGPGLAANLRDAVERMTVFMEAGHLSNRKADEEIHVILARMLREVLVPGRPDTHRSFHPKVWVLHFSPIGGEGSGRTADRVRLIVSSRNLTRSMSRDAMVVLEGRVGEKRVARNTPISDFLRALPAMVTSHGNLETGPADTKAAVETLAELAGRTSFKAPHGFKLEGFVFAGPDRKATAWAPKACERLSVISPFCDDRTLEQYRQTSGAKELMLVSRKATLDGLKSRLTGETNASWQAYYFDEAASRADPLPEDEVLDTSSADRSDQLHAKMYVEEGGRSGTRFTIGSGNATSPAREGRNVEFYAIMTTDAQTPLVPSFMEFSNDECEDVAAHKGFSSLLQKYMQNETEEAVEAEEDDEFDPQMRFAIYELLDGRFSLRFTQDAGGAHWVCQLVCEASPKWEGALSEVTVRVKPAPASEDAFVDVKDMKAGDSHSFMPVAVVELSPFITFELTGPANETFTTQLPHEGFPDRLHLSAVMRRKLPHASDWLGALLASLDEDISGAGGRHANFGMGGGSVTTGFSATTPLLEALVKNLDKPQSLAAFARTLDSFGEAVAADPEPGGDVQALEDQRAVYETLREFWTPFAGFLPPEFPPKKERP